MHARMHILLLIVVAALVTGCGSVPRTDRVVTPETLATVLAEPLPAGTLLRLEPGEYWLTPTVLRERPRGPAGEDEEADDGGGDAAADTPDVSDTDTPVDEGGADDDEAVLEISVGLRLRTPGLRIQGAGADSTILHTGAAQGLRFEEAAGCVVSGLTITGGVRAEDRRVPCAAVVVQDDAEVRIESCRIAGNLGDPAVLERTVAGISGVLVRRGGSAWIRDNELLGNSWDAISVRDDAQAMIENNVIDGLDAGVGSPAGRGVGIALADRCTARVYHNYVTRTWKGIGVFGSPTAVVRENIVEQVRLWGLAVWAGPTGTPRARVSRNLVHGTGACGATITVRDPASEGEFRDNLLWRTGQDPAYDAPEVQCEQCALALHAVVDGFLVQDNLAFASREAEDQPPRDDADEERFFAALDALRAPFGAWVALRRSSLFAEPPAEPVAELPDPRRVVP